MIILIYDEELHPPDFNKDFLIMAMLEKNMQIKQDVKAIEIITKEVIKLDDFFIDSAVAGHNGRSVCMETDDSIILNNIFSKYHITSINEYVPYSENIDICNKHIRYKMREVFKHIDIIYQEFYDNKIILYYRHGMRVLQSTDMINWTVIMDTINYKNYFNGKYKWE